MTPMTEEVTKSIPGRSKCSHKGPGWRYDDAFRSERYPARPVPGKYAVWHGYGEEQEGSHPQPSREGGAASPWTGLELGEGTCSFYALFLLSLVQSGQL